MNATHLRAFVWLRWRLLVNRMRRGGTANAVILALLAITAVVASIGLAVTLFLVAWLALGHVPDSIVMYVWDGLIAVFLFFWGIGLLTDLQRSDSLSMEKFLHLPVSPAGAFLVNYVSSLFSVTLAIFLPAMLALALGLVLGRGPSLLVQFPLLATFLLAVTALTYQFQGWLGALMVDPRRRRTIIVLVTLAFILSCQVPNLLNILHPWAPRGETERAARDRKEQDDLEHALAVHEITPEEFAQRMGALKRVQKARKEQTERQVEERMDSTVRLASTVLPPFWPALGAESAAENNVLPAVFGTLGLGLVGAASLWRAYRTTLRLYTGQLSAGGPARAAPTVAVPAAKVGKPSAGILEKELPYLSESASAIALGGFRSLLRAPEAKMMLLSPLILVLVFGSALLSGAAKPPASLRPLVAFGGMAAALLGTAQVACNMFGFDRDGFRVFVLSAVPRREILLGKNLALAPVALTLETVLFLLVELILPMRVDYFLAAVPQLLVLYLLFCMGANWLSVLAPMRIAAGSFKAANPKGVVLLLHLAFVFLFPLLLAPALLPAGVQLLVDALAGERVIPIAPLLALAECVGVVYLYRLCLTWQGQLLQAREQAILRAVTTKN